MPIMTLKQYIAQEGRGALSALAEKVGTSKGYLHDIMNGSVPSPAIAKRIEQATEKKVKAAVVLGLGEAA
jgi:transcriptional regulator with XRE-family HTH domain